MAPKHPKQALQQCLQYTQQEKQRKLLQPGE